MNREEDATVFELRVEDDVVQIAKTTVIDSDVHNVRRPRGLYVISNATIQDLQVVVEYENDVVVDGQNSFVSKNAETTHVTVCHEDLVVEAISKASPWKLKV